MEQVAEPEEITTAKSGRSRGQSAPSAGSAVVLGPRDSLVGTLTVDADVRIHGAVEGELRAGGDVDVEQTATVNARIEGRAITVRGTVGGTIAARQRLVVAGSGTVNGDVRVPRLQVDDGATINGNISMGPVEEPKPFDAAPQSSDGASEATRG